MASSSGSGEQKEKKEKKSVHSEMMTARSGRVRLAGAQTDPPSTSSIEVPNPGPCSNCKEKTNISARDRWWICLTCLQREKPSKRYILCQLCENGLDTYEDFMGFDSPAFHDVTHVFQPLSS